MKVKRHKRIRKFTQFYKMTYGIRPPYKVVVDGDFLQAVLEGKVMLSEQLPKMLQEETTPFVTKCVMHELKGRKRGNFFKGAIMIGEKCRYLRCNHEGVVSPHECIKKLIGEGNPDGLFVGAQTKELRALVRREPGVPLIFIRNQVPILEPPSVRTFKQIKKKRIAQGSVTEEEKKLLARLKNNDDDDNNNNTHKKKKRKGPKGANPLSCKKKKKTQQQQQQQQQQPKKNTKPKKEETKANDETDKPTDQAIEQETEDEGGKKTRKRKRVRVRIRKRSHKKEDGEVDSEKATDNNNEDNKAAEE